MQCISFIKPNILYITAYQDILHDGALHYHSATNNTDPSILFLALNENEQSWSSDFREIRRTAYDFMDMLLSTKLDLANASLAIWTAPLGQYNKIRVITESLPFARVDIYHRAETKPAGCSYEHTHSPAA